jgi:NTE family protein
MSLRFTHLKEDYQPGSTSLDALPISKKVHNSISFRNYFESYTPITKKFTLGWIADITISNRTAMGDRISSLLYLPAFQPTPHSKTLLLSSNRSQSFVGLAVMPIFRFTKSLSVHVMGAYFQPYKLLEKTNGRRY